MIQIHIGTRTILVNAHSADDAFELADSHAGDLVFPWEPIAQDELDNLLERASDASRGQGSLPQPGAWVVEIARVSYFEDGLCYDQNRHALLVAHASPRPHDEPHAQLTPDYWKAMALARDERMALDATAGAAAPTHRRTHRKP